MRQHDDPYLYVIQRGIRYCSKRLIFALLALGCQQNNTPTPTRQEVEALFKRPPVAPPVYGTYSRGHLRPVQKPAY